MSINSELFERYHKERNSGKASKTIRLEGFVLKRLVSYVNKPMEQITKQDLVNYFDFLEKQLSPYTIVTHKILVKKFFKWLYKSKETGKIPEQVLWIEINKKKAYKHKTKAELLTQDEIQKMIDVCKRPLEKAMIAVHADLGTRPGEFCSMKLGDIVQESDGLSACVTGKTGERIIPLNGSSQYLMQYLEKHPDKNNRNAPLWISQQNKQFSDSGFYTMVKRLAKRAGITKNVYGHLFRHVRLTQLAKEKLPESIMRNYAGWEANSAMPSVYLHMDGSDVKDAIRKIEPQQPLFNLDIGKQKMKDELRAELKEEILAELIETLGPQHKVVQDFCYNETEQA